MKSTVHFKGQFEAIFKRKSLNKLPIKLRLYLLILVSIGLFAFTFLPNNSKKKALYSKKSILTESSVNVQFNPETKQSFHYQIYSQEPLPLTVNTMSINLDKSFYLPLSGPTFNYLPFYTRINSIENSKEFYLYFDGYSKEKSAFFFHCIVYNQQNQIVKSNSYAYKNKLIKYLLNFDDLETGNYKIEIRYGALKQTLDLNI